MEDLENVFKDINSESFEDAFNETIEYLTVEKKLDSIEAYRHVILLSVLCKIIYYQNSSGVINRVS
jgi:hypothetical protein